MNFDCIHDDLHSPYVDNSFEDEENLLLTIIKFFDQQLYLTEDLYFEGNEGLLDAQSDLAELYMNELDEVDKAKAVFCAMLEEEPGLSSTHFDYGQAYHSSAVVV